MSKKEIKNLNSANLKKEVKNISSQTEHTVQVGENKYKIKIDDVFRKTKQHKLLDDIVEFFNQSNKRADLFDLATPYTTLMFIKHFTSVEISDDIDEAVEMLNVLIDLELFGEIMNLMPESEVTDVYELLASTVKRMSENMDETADEAIRLSQIVDNRELKEALKNEPKQS